MKNFPKISAMIVAIIILAMIYLPAVNGEVDQTKTPIKHVINIYFENHSFDNFFGIYPYNPYNNTMFSNLTIPENILNNGTLMKMLKPVPNGIFSTPNPEEGYMAYHLDWNNGKMNGFENSSGPQSLMYYTSYQLGALWSLAEEYSLADHYFSPVLSESAPNTLFYVAGFSPVINDYGPPPYVPFNQTIFYELNSYGISWGFYTYNGSPVDPWEYIYGIDIYTNHLHSWQELLSELENNTLPSVTWIFSQDFQDYDMGPPKEILQGELFLLYLINKIETSPVWNSTAIFVTWDEFGGFYDHVSPPSIDGLQYGPRVPLIIISPYSKEDYVSHTLMTHLSILAFIDYNWNLPPLNKNVAISNIPIDMFFFQEKRSPIKFPDVIPKNIFFKVENFSNYNLSKYFPLKPQIPFNELPYQRYGNSSLNLSSYNVFVKNNNSYTPFFLSMYFLEILLALEILLFIIILYLRKKGGGIE